MKGGVEVDVSPGSGSSGRIWLSVSAFRACQPSCQPSKAQIRKEAYLEAYVICFLRWSYYINSELVLTHRLLCHPLSESVPTPKFQIHHNRMTKTGTSPQSSGSSKFKRLRELHTVAFCIDMIVQFSSKRRLNEVFLFNGSTPSWRILEAASELFSLLKNCSRPYRRLLGCAATSSTGQEIWTPRWQRATTTRIGKKRKWTMVSFLLFVTN